MNSLIKVLVIILIFQGSTASFSSVASNLVSNISSKVSSSVTSLENAVSNSSISDYLKSLQITADGVLDLNTMIQKLNVTNNVFITSIMSSLNVSEGLLDLKSLTQNLNLTEVNFASVLSLLNVTTTDEILDFISLAQNMTNNVNVTELLNSSTVNTEEAILDFKGLAWKYFGTVEEYNVTTEDGCILTVFRIANKDSNKVVLLSHGFFCSSDDYILRGNTSLVYTLVKNGYDVWVINYRGNRYSRRHVSLDPDTDARFWDYSMQELGYYDLSATVDFILNKTGQEQLSVIGHSEGTAAVFVLLTLKTEYNTKIKVFVALSPVCYLSNTGLAFKLLIRSRTVFNNLLLALGVEELVGYELLSRKLIQTFCSQGTVGYELCYKGAMSALFGYNPDNLEADFLISVLGHFPAGTSRKNLDHYLYIGKEDRFAQYDYGTNNTEIYGTETAPNYNLTDVTCPVSLFMGANDYILGLKDAERLRGELVNVVEYHVVEDEKFTHTDFIWGFNATDVVYKPVLTTLESYNKVSN